jgi:hypothetical protein
MTRLTSGGGGGGTYKVMFEVVTAGGSRFPVALGNAMIFWNRGINASQELARSLSLSLQEERKRQHYLPKC